MTFPYFFCKEYGSHSMPGPGVHFAPFPPPQGTPLLYGLLSAFTACAGSSASALQSSGPGLLPMVRGNVVPRAPAKLCQAASPALPLARRCQQCRQGQKGPSQSRDSPVWLCSGTSPLFWCRTQPAPRSPPSAPRCTRCGQSFLPAGGGHSPRTHACADISSFLLCCSPAPGGCCPAQQPCTETSTVSCLGALGCKLWTACSIPDDPCARPSRETSKGEGQGSSQPGPGADLSSISGDIKATAGSHQHHTPHAAETGGMAGSKDTASSTTRDAHETMHMQGPGTTAPIHTCAMPNTGGVWGKTSQDCRALQGPLHCSAPAAGVGWERGLLGYGDTGWGELL